MAQRVYKLPWYAMGIGALALPGARKGCIRTTRRTFEIKGEAVLDGHLHVRTTKFKAQHRQT